MGRPAGTAEVWEVDFSLQASEQETETAPRPGQCSPIPLTSFLSHVVARCREQGTCLDRRAHQLASWACSTQCIVH